MQLPKYILAILFISGSVHAQNNISSPKFNGTATGELTWTGTNAFTGITTITSGTLALTTVNTGTISGGTLAPVTVSATGDVDAGGDVNASGSFNGNGSALTGMIWSQIGSTPTTLSGYGITDALPLAGGTVTGNVVLDGTANTMNNQTDSAAGSPMTRQLLDARGSYFVWGINLNAGAARADDASWLIGPGGYNAFSTSLPASIPAEMTKFRVRVSMGFTTNPTADTFPVYVRFNSNGINSTNATETLHGTRVGTTCYPDTVGGLTGTLVDLAATHSGFVNTFSFTSDWVTIPAAWQTNAANVGSYGFLGIIVGNKSGGSVTDNYGQNHSIYGQIEFRR